MSMNLLSSIRKTYWRLARFGSLKRVRSYPPDFSESEIKILEAVYPYTLTTYERIISLIRTIDYISESNLVGDIVECGVWKGGSMMAVALALTRNKQTHRVLHLFDTFDGMPPPTDLDKDFLGNSAARQMEIQNKDASIWARAQLDEVTENMNSTAYPRENLRFVKGKVEDTLPAKAPDSIALLRLDTDWYESTKHELDHLFPRLVPGGVLIVDDYGHWQGARKAVDEYVKMHRLRILLCRIDMAARIAIKQR